MWQKLRPRLSGVAATARFVIDVPFGYGKVPIPEGDGWEVNYEHFKDFKKKQFPIA
jgi:lysine 2,3-aminomutase